MDQLTDSLLHRLLQLDEPVLDVSGANHLVNQLDRLLIDFLVAQNLEDVSDLFGALVLLGEILEGDSSHGVEELIEVVLDFGGFGSLGQKLEQEFVRDEVEPWEFLSFLFEVFIEFLLAGLQVYLEDGKGLLDDFTHAAGFDEDEIGGLLHHNLFPLLVNLLKLLSLLFEMLGDVSLKEDSLQRGPEVLHLDPEDEGLFDFAEVALPELDVVLEGGDLSHSGEAG